MIRVDDRTDLTVAAELHHPALPHPFIHRGSGEREARTLAYRHALRDRLRGFRIVVPSILPPEPAVTVPSEGLCIPEA